ncbi:MAG TPA: galactose mutarotase [Candidatus Marinimicrobia bacterium]|nr:galactose mutarotase [Candidatus Neomarinimicrobiota bacterium]
MDKFKFALILLLGVCGLSCSGKRSGAVPNPQVFGRLDNGETIYLYTLANRTGMTAQIINYGAIMVSLKVPDGAGNFQDVILGFDDLEGYVNDQSYQGAVVGRFGNRIAGGKIHLDGKDYQLSVNDGNNHLHGGFTGFFKAVWDAQQESPNTLRLTLVSPAGEEGYPGNVHMTVTYCVTEDNSLKIEYRGTTDEPTILNPTSHGYFNLTGSPQNSILEHHLIIDADYITPVNSTLIPTGELLHVQGTPFDFRKPRPIGEAINADHEQLRFGSGYDHNWVLNNHTGAVRKVAELYDPDSGRLMEVLTDQPGLQFYSGNFLDGSLVGKKGQKYGFRTALCLEAQHFPDSPNKPNFPSVILRPGEEYGQTTIYRFSVK